MLGIMTNDRKCGDCVFLVEDEGEPFYCAIRDLYTTREKDDSGCKDWRGACDERGQDTEHE